MDWVRHLLRLDAWATALGVQLALAHMLFIPSGIITFEHVIDLMGDPRSSEWSIGKSLRHTLLSPALAIAGAASGAWIAATMPHHRFPSAMATWITLMLLGHFGAVLLRAGLGDWGSLFEEWHTGIGPPASSVGWMLFTLLIYAMWMFIGWPLGLLMQRGSVAIRRVRFRLRRRRARRFRRGQ